MLSFHDLIDPITLILIIRIFIHYASILLDLWNFVMDLRLKLVQKGSMSYDGDNTNEGDNNYDGDNTYDGDITYDGDNTCW